MPLAISSASSVDVGSSTLSGAASTSSRMVGSAMKPHFTTSAMPLRSSSSDSEASASRSHSTPAGSWNAPTRFLPDAVLMPVLPPTAASTMPSTVVGIVTKRTPRSQLAATKPARSVVEPPPSPTTTSERVNPASPSASQHRVRTSADLAASPSGTSTRCTSRSASTVRRPVACSRSVGGCTIATRRASSPTSALASLIAPWPTTTSYGDAVCTVSLVVMTHPS
jgi:hypothetical protein